MGTRTGAAYLANLRDDRSIWIDGERVKDVTTDRRFAGAAGTMAMLLDMQHDAALRRAHDLCVAEQRRPRRAVVHSACLGR